MSFDRSLFGSNPEFYEFLPGSWIPNTMTLDGQEGDMKGTIQKCVDAELDESDILIAAYPKTGQTWTMTIIQCILQIKQLENGKDLSLDNFFDSIPFMESKRPGELCGAEKFAKLEPPRFMKTHLPYQIWKPQLEKHPNLRVIQILRNPKDALVSYYHHYKSSRALGPFLGDWDQFFEMHKQKLLSWGDFFEHNLEWYKFNQNRPNSLILIYEEMKKDPKAQVARIAKFTGHNISDHLVDLIAEKSSVEAISGKFNNFMRETIPGWKGSDKKFIRKGQVGDWKNYFSDEQSKIVEEQAKKYFEPLGLSFEYE